MAFKVLVTFIWFLATAFVVFGISEIAHSQLDIISKIILYIVGFYAETLVSILFIEGMGS